jgi:uncharacterized protein with HEPN domain
MFDNELVLSILIQIDDALQKISIRSGRFNNADEFINSPSGMETLDSICMLFIAIGEAIKNVDKITDGTLLSQYPDIDWKGVKGFRNVIAHQYFDVDADQVFWICKNELEPLSITICKMIKKLQ